MAVSYDFEMERVLREIAEKKAERVLIQLPEGLRPRALGLMREVEERAGVEAYISGGSCYGGCDIALAEAEALGVDLIIHYGHSRLLPDGEVPVLYVELRADFDVDALLRRALPPLEGWRRVGLASTVQHVHLLPRAAEVLEGWGFEALLGGGGGWTPHDGQVLGCASSTALSIAEEVDGFLFIGGGRFHPLGLALATGREVVAADPYGGGATRIGEGEVRRLLRRRMAAIQRVREARRIGVVVSVKPGQRRIREAEELRGELERRGWEAAIIALDVVRADILNDFTELEAFIDTACPRIALDGLPELRRPMITLQEAYVMMGVVDWEEMMRRSYLGGSWRRP
ncbi:MAG: diphthamide biosynthesis protein [Candidatus Bathyarchaeota archaeon B23]|nr:MAG: diphthamide biosynthesis protein [Candidatus Bathyarchaeota archaeon B23]